MSATRGSLVLTVPAITEAQQAAEAEADSVARERAEKHIRIYAESYAEATVQGEVRPVDIETECVLCERLLGGVPLSRNVYVLGPIIYQNERYPICVLLDASTVFGELFPVLAEDTITNIWADEEVSEAATRITKEAIRLAVTLYLRWLFDLAEGEELLAEVAKASEELANRPDSSEEEDDL